MPPLLHGALLRAIIMCMFRRAISVSGRVGAPSMLLVVTKDLPPRMSRPCWCLKDYVVLEKMYTGAHGFCMPRRNRISTASLDGPTQCIVMHLTCSRPGIGVAEPAN
eukprot:1160647-Pelagomonas_calceolata.AAC.6